MSQTLDHSVPRTLEAGIAEALGSRSLVLVGMMGAGKSSVGRKLAGRLAASRGDDRCVALLSDIERRERRREVRGPSRHR